MRSFTLIKAAWLLASSASVNADVTTTIDPKSNWGTWEGWGTSLAWWAQEFGDRDDLADVFFTLGQTKVNGQSLPGLGFNIVRYNAGACSWNTVDGKKMVVSPKIKRSRQMEGYWVDWNSSDPQSASWNWYGVPFLWRTWEDVADFLFRSVDVNQRAALQKAIARGADRTELFSNSPMWWM
jgi:galactan endo-1,6-beta-galactosidase